MIRNCIICKGIDSHAYPSVNMPDLLSVRVADDPPFASTGVDFAGPL